MAQERGGGGGTVQSNKLTRSQLTSRITGPTPSTGPALPAGYGTVLKNTPTPGYVAPAPAPSGGGGGGGGMISGGGGGGAPAAPAAPPWRPSFEDYIANDFGYKTAQNEGTRRLQDFDAQTLMQRQQTEAEQNLRRQALQQSLQDMGSDWANDTANRGILRSGLYMQGQDKVDQAGVRGNQGIDQLLTELLTSRQQDRVGVEAQTRAALNDVLSQLSSQYNSGLQIA